MDPKLECFLFTLELVFEYFMNRSMNERHTNVYGRLFSSYTRHERVLLAHSSMLTSSFDAEIDVKWDFQ